MSKLKLGPIVEDKPVRLAVELPAGVHRDLIAYAEVLAAETGQAAAGRRHPGGQFGDELRIRCSRAHPRQVAGAGAVESHELIGLSPAEVVAPHEHIETFPLIAVRRGESIKIHARSLS